jgi:hypothetical protein
LPLIVAAAHYAITSYSYSYALALLCPVLSSPALPLPYFIR